MIIKMGTVCSVLLVCLVAFNGYSQKDSPRVTNKKKEVMLMNGIRPSVSELYIANVDGIA